MGWIIGEGEAAVDYDLVAFDKENLFKRLRMGVNKKIFWDRVSIRTGLNEGYPSIGLVIDLYIFKLNYAYYSIERGLNLGDNPESFHSLDIGFLF